MRWRYAMTLEVTWAGFALGVGAGVLVSFVVLMLLVARHAKRSKPLQDSIRDSVMQRLGEKN